MAHSAIYKPVEELTSGLCPVVIDPIQQVGPNLGKKEELRRMVVLLMESCSDLATYF